MDNTDGCAAIEVSVSSYEHTSTFMFIIYVYIFWFAGPPPPLMVMVPASPHCGVGWPLHGNGALSPPPVRWEFSQISKHEPMGSIIGALQIITV